MYFGSQNIVTCSSASSSVSGTGYSSTISWEENESFNYTDSDIELEFDLPGDIALSTADFLEYIKTNYDFYRPVPLRGTAGLVAATTNEAVSNILTYKVL